MICFHDAGCKLPGDTFVCGLLASPLTIDPRVVDLSVAQRDERWLWTADLVKELRRCAPKGLRPAGRLRHLFRRTRRD